MLVYCGVREGLICWTCYNKSNNKLCNDWAPNLSCPPCTNYLLIYFLVYCADEILVTTVLSLSVCVFIIIIITWFTVHCQRMSVPFQFWVKSTFKLSSILIMCQFLKKKNWRKIPETPKHVKHFLSNFIIIYNTFQVSFSTFTLCLGNGKGPNLSKPATAIPKDFSWVIPKRDRLNKKKRK